MEDCYAYNLTLHFFTAMCQWQVSCGCGELQTNLDLHISCKIFFLHAWWSYFVIMYKAYFVLKINLNDSLILPELFLITKSYIWQATASG